MHRCLLRTWSISWATTDSWSTGRQVSPPPRPTKRIATWWPQSSRPSAIVRGWWPVSARTTLHIPSRALLRPRWCAWRHGRAPYYNRPPQEGLITHFHAIADATDLPLLTYDIPKRTGVAIETETLARIAEHPNVVANKDAKGDLDATQWAMARTDLAWYCGDDILNLPMLMLGASGMVSVVGHVVGDRLKEMAQALAAGDVSRARAINAELLPVYTGLFRTQGVILTKAALRMQGLPAGGLRLPLVDATPAQEEQLRIDLAGVRGIGA